MVIEEGVGAFLLHSCFDAHGAESAPFFLGFEDREGAGGEEGCGDDEEPIDGGPPGEAGEEGGDEHVEDAPGAAEAGAFFVDIALHAGTPEIVNESYAHLLVGGGSRGYFVGADTGEN